MIKLIGIILITIKIKMSKGFITVAENSIIDGEVVDYFRLAYGLALSIKATQTEISNISVLISEDTKIPNKYKEVFDEIIRIPWSTIGEGLRFHNEPMAYFLTPYQETIKLEADMLFVNDIEHIWTEYLLYMDLWFTSHVYTYRNDIIYNPEYRHDFVSNNLPNIYNGMMYFNKGDFSTEFFKMAAFIIKNWQEVTETLLDHTRPTKISTDVVYAMAIKFLDINDIVVDNIFKFGFVHMKNELMDWDRKYGYNKWYDNVNCFVTNDLEIKVGHYKQIYPFHYYEKDFLTNEIIKKYERYLGI